MTVRPEIEEDTIEKLDLIIDNAVSVPLSSDELSINKKVKIVTESVWAEYQKNAGPHDTPHLVVDRHDTSE